MKILGIGNAIVDVICKVEDNFLSKKVVTKESLYQAGEKLTSSILYMLSSNFL